MQSYAAWLASTQGFIPCQAGVLVDCSCLASLLTFGLSTGPSLGVWNTVVCCDLPNQDGRKEDCQSGRLRAAFLFIVFDFTCFPELPSGRRQSAVS